MDKTEMQLLKLSAAFIAVLFLGLLVPQFQDLLYGIIRNTIGGYSLGKMILIFSWLIVLPLIAFLAVKSGICTKIRKYDIFLLRIFILFSVAGYALGLVQFNLYAMQFGSFGPFATMISDGDYTNWEASKLSHNHFPKITLYYIERALGIDLEGKFDDGRPLFEIYPDAEAFALAFLLIVAVIIVSGFLHIFSRMHKMRWPDFLLFELAVISVIITMLDGGVGSVNTVLAIFFFALYYVRSYRAQDDANSGHILGLLIAAFAAFAVSAFLGINLSGIFVAPALLLIGIAYYFFKNSRTKRLSFSLWNSALAILLVVSAAVSIANVLSFSLGVPLTLDSEGIGRIFIFGLPPGASALQLQEILSEFGDVGELSKVHWAAYAEIKLNKDTRTREIEKALIAELKPKSYLYVEDALPISQTNMYKIHWLGGLGNSDASEFLDNEFLGNKIIEIQHSAKENTTTIALKSELEVNWQMLSILTEIRSRGYEGKLMVEKVG